MHHIRGLSLLRRVSILYYKSQISKGTYRHSTAAWAIRRRIPDTKSLFRKQSNYSQHLPHSSLRTANCQLQILFSRFIALMAARRRGRCHTAGAMTDYSEPIWIHFFIHGTRSWGEKAVREESQSPIREEILEVRSVP
jgi:hypothetical protein